MDTFNLLISTSNKWWHNTDNLVSFCEKYNNAISSVKTPIQLYSTANRVDEIDLCELLVNTFGLDPVIPLKADWTKNGTKALYLRNNELVKIIDAGIIFWDGKTKSEIDLYKLCQTKNKPCKCYKFDIDLNRR